MKAIKSPVAFSMALFRVSAIFCRGSTQYVIDIGDAAVDDSADDLAVIGHVARADPVAERLGGPLLAIFQGPHGYVSASWYEDETIPTWNYVILHLRGTPEVFDDAMPVLRRTVDHFEAAVTHPWSLDRMPDTTREMAGQVVAFRLAAAWWHAEAKLSQDKPPLADLHCATPARALATADTVVGQPGSESRRSRAARPTYRFSFREISISRS